VMVGPELGSGLAVRKLARVAQTVVVAAEGAALDRAGAARQLGMLADSIRIVPVRPGDKAPESAPVARPMSVVRLQKCA